MVNKIMLIAGCMLALNCGAYDTDSSTDSAVEFDLQYDLAKIGRSDGLEAELEADYVQQSYASKERKTEFTQRRAALAHSRAERMAQYENLLEHRARQKAEAAAASIGTPTSAPRIKDRYEYNLEIVDDLAWLLGDEGKPPLHIAQQYGALDYGRRVRKEREFEQKLIKRRYEILHALPRGAASNYSVPSLLPGITRKLAILQVAEREKFWADKVRELLPREEVAGAGSAKK